MEDGMSMNLELPTFSSNIKKRSMWCLGWFSFIPNEVW
jgi:hypothetical protein